MTGPKLKFTADHLWLKRDGNRVTIGLTEHGLLLAGMILYVSLPLPGIAIRRGELLAEYETVERETVLYSPLSGTVEAVNMLLERATDVLHESPYGKGWLVAIGSVEDEEWEGLLTEEQYASWTQEAWEEEDT